MRVWISLVGLPVIVFASQAPAAKPTEPMKHGPLDYYQGHCARCHGDMGGAYPDDFTKDKTIDEMRDVIKSMAAGQGGSPLTNQAEFEAQVAFHYSIDLKKPFLDWTLQQGQKLSGEVTPDAKVSASLGGSELAVVVEKGIWSLTLPAASDVHKVVLQATLGTAKASLDLAKSSFSRPVSDKKG